MLLDFTYVKPCSSIRIFDGVYSLLLCCLMTLNPSFLYLD